MSRKDVLVCILVGLWLALGFVTYPLNGVLG